MKNIRQIMTIMYLMIKLMTKTENKMCPIIFAGNRLQKVFFNYWLYLAKSKSINKKKIHCLHHL